LIEEALTNLVRNAREALGERGRVSFARERGQVVELARLAIREGLMSV
jgi:signal transduction histidine kinase